MSYNLEIEFKFKVDKKLLPPFSEAVNVNSIRQFYLSQGFSWYDSQDERQKKGPEIRVVIRNNKKAEITMKCDTDDKAARHEFSFPISVEEANALEEHRVGYTILKKRYFFKMTKEESPQLFDKVMWEVDVYEAENEGLVVAEFEIPEDFTQEYSFTPPKWVIKNVTGNENFSNGFLAMRPWKIREDAWKKVEDWLNETCYPGVDSLEAAKKEWKRLQQADDLNGRNEALLLRFWPEAKDD